MTALPAATAFTDSATTEAQFKTAITGLRGFLSGLLGADGVPSTALATLQAIFAAGLLSKTGAYTVAVADKGKIIGCSGTWALSLPAAATAGAGFAIAVKNSGSGVITIDPSGAELVNGAATLALAAGKMAILVCSGSQWWTFGGPLPDAGLSKDMGHDNVGSLCFASSTDSVAPLTVLALPGATVSGSILRAAGFFDFGTGHASHSAALSGTWRCLGYAYNAHSSYTNPVQTLFQRIA